VIRGGYIVSAEIIELDAYRLQRIQSIEDEPCDIATAIDVAIRDLREILQYWGSEGARARAVECERLLSRVYQTEVRPVC
jgi:hypothetical protein